MKRSKKNEIKLYPKRFINVDNALNLEKTKIHFVQSLLDKYKKYLLDYVKLINDLIVGTQIDEVSSKLEFEIKPIISKYVKQHEMIYNAFY